MSTTVCGRLRAPGLALLLAVALGAGCTSAPSAARAPAASAAPASSLSAEVWEQLKAAAIKEGRVAINGTATPELRQATVEAFRAAYGIDVDYQSMSTAEFLGRADREFKAGAVSFDLATGVSNCYTMAQRGQIENFNGVLIHPDAVDPTKWRDGGTRLFRAGPTLPADFICGSQFGEEIQPQLFINPEVVPPSAIATWEDLLKPEFKGKIVSHDPRGGGAGQGTAVSITYGLGEDYFLKLFKGQDVALSRDYRQVADWLVRGRYPIALGISSQIAANFMTEGLPIVRHFPANGPDAVTAGSAGLSIMKNAPHPNAAKLFANWLHTREGQELWELHNHTPSLRTDTARATVPDWIVPKAEVAYKLHDGEPEFFNTYREPIVQRVQELLTR